MCSHTGFARTEYPASSGTSQGSPQRVHEEFLNPSCPTASRAGSDVLSLCSGRSRSLFHESCQGESSEFLEVSWFCFGFVVVIFATHSGSLFISLQQRGLLPLQRGGIPSKAAASKGKLDFQRGLGKKSGKKQPPDVADRQSSTSVVFTHRILSAHRRVCPGRVFCCAPALKTNQFLQETLSWLGVMG